jgi:hypothetical protein
MSSIKDTASTRKIACKVRRSNACRGSDGLGDWGRSVMRKAAASLASHMARARIAGRVAQLRVGVHLAGALNAVGSPGADTLRFTLNSTRSIFV